MAKSEVRNISPRTGRPRKEVTKSESLQLRITKATADKLQHCANRLQVSRTEVIERGIDMVADMLDKEEK